MVKKDSKGNCFFGAGEKYRVYLTGDTLRGILLEVARHPTLECFIQMPGRRIGNDFYFDTVADSGIRATYQYAMCEKDHEYCDHLSTRIAEYYDFPAEQLTLSQIHKHPPGFARFSSGDGPANKHLACQFGGVVNGLILVDPEFKLRFWYIDVNGKETPAEYLVDDERVRKAMPKKKLSDLKTMVERNEANGFARKKTGQGRKMHTFFGDMKKSRSTKKGEQDMDEKTRMGTESVSVAAAENTMDFETWCKKNRPYRILISREFKETAYEGPLYGYYIDATKTFNVVKKRPDDVREDMTVIGMACRAGTSVRSEDVQKGLYIEWNPDGKDVCRVADNPNAEVSMEYYSLRHDVFSRNEGILESNQMANKQAVIAGAGSGGFFIALELVKAGIGSILIADDDVFEYHNICRHVCGIHDVGKFKVDCFRERAADINPDCKVFAFRELIQHMDWENLQDVLWEHSIIICCTDNRHAGYVCNELADKFHIPMVEAGCGPRASTGEVFYYKPDSGMPCYECAFGEDRGVDHANQAVRRKFYATESELEKLHYQPGLALDVELTAIFETKLAIDLLMENEDGYKPKLLPYTKQCSVIMNYPVDKDVNPYMQLFDINKGHHPLSWKTMAVQKNPNCPHCRRLK